MSSRLQNLESAIISMLADKGIKASLYLDLMRIEAETSFGVLMRIESETSFGVLNTEMGLDALNKKVRDDANLSSATRQLFCDYESQNEEKRRSRAHSRIRENPLDVSGKLKAIFFVNRKSLFKTRMQKKTGMMISLNVHGGKCTPMQSMSAAAGGVPTNVNGSMSLVQPLCRLEEPTNSDSTLYHGFQLDNGWQEWTAPDGRKYVLCKLHFSHSLSHRLVFSMQMYP